MDTEKIVDYVMETPGNTNPNVLRSLLDDGSSSNNFIVTLTPTAQDYSGTMNKTETEISDAYEAGQQVVFRVVGIPGYDYIDVNVTEALYDTSYNRWQMSAYLVMLPNTLIYIYNGISSDGDAARYWTRVFTLTPAS